MLVLNTMFMLFRKGNKRKTYFSVEYVSNGTNTKIRTIRLTGRVCQNLCRQNRQNGSNPIFGTIFSILPILSNVERVRAKSMVNAAALPLVLHIFPKLRVQTAKRNRVKHIANDGKCVTMPHRAVIP